MAATGILLGIFVTRHPMANLFLVALLALTAGSGCVGTSAWDRRVGAEVAREVEVSMGLLADPDLTTYVSRVGHRLVNEIEATDFVYRFEVVDQRAPNAFALPGGYVYITRGMLATTNSEDELANVIAHEIGHVEARHAAERYQAATLPALATLPGALVGVVHKDLGDLIASPFEHVGMAFLASYSRDQERAADQLGQRLAARAGYDPHGLSTSLRVIDQYQKLTSRPADIPSHLQTHPETGPRADETARFAAKIHWQPRPGITRDHAHYLRKLDALIVGPNPARGLFRGRTFYHPDLGITMTMPARWVPVKGQGAVGAIAPTYDAMLIATTPSTGNDPSSAAKAFLNVLQQQIQIEVTEAGSRTINGLNAYGVRSIAGPPDRAINFELLWITHNDLLYQFIGVASHQTKRHHLQEIQDSQASFRPISTRERNSFRVQRLRIVKALSGESMKQLKERFDVSGPLHWLTAINGINRNTEMVEGQLVKIVSEETYRPATPNGVVAKPGNSL